MDLLTSVPFRSKRRRIAPLVSMALAGWPLGLKGAASALSSLGGGFLEVSLSMVPSRRPSSVLWYFR